jgi:muconolactone delta-isomerase
MEYLVEMTTNVPDGTPEEDVQETRAREAVRARELATAGDLLRLWRPPLRPGEWRTLGLFAAENDRDLETTLESMPLRVWRTDEATPLLAHPNDPASAPVPAHGPQVHIREFLTTFTITVPAGTRTQAVDETGAKRGSACPPVSRPRPPNAPMDRAWRVAHPRSLAGARRDGDAGDPGLPTPGPWMTVEVTPLSVHPNDPAAVPA